MLRRDSGLPDMLVSGASDADGGLAVGMVELLVLPSQRGNSLNACCFTCTWAITFRGRVSVDRLGELDEKVKRDSSPARETERHSPGDVSR